MYGAMREHASSSTRLAGGATSLTVTTALAIAIVVGMGGQMMKEKEAPLMFTVLPEQQVEPTPLDIERDFDMAKDVTLDVVKPVVDIDDFVYDEPPIRVTVDPTPRANPGPAGPSIPASPTPPKPPGVRTAAKLIPAKAPPYPGADIREGNEGVSVLEVCLDARGRVTSASVSETSGHDTLDQAALKWVRAAKFTPAKVDGAPQAVCGHSVSYEWTLKKR